MEQILILGGTNFIGRNLVEKLIELDNYDITLFNRGISNPNLFPGINEIHGDRATSDIEIVVNQHWDYIIDLSCYFPNSLDRILPLLNAKVKRYILISSCSVYDNEINKSILRNESAPILTCSMSESEDTSNATYGKRKAECERKLIQSNIKYTIFRPALVYGKYDTSDRLYYWLYQLKMGNDLLIPNGGKSIFSVTYVHDLVQVIIASLNSENSSDIYNVTTYPNVSISKLLETAFPILNSSSKEYFADSAFLNENDIEQWTDLPLWLDCDYFTYDNKKAIEELKLEITDFDNTVSDTIEYFDSTNWKTPNYGISEKTKKVLIDSLSNLKN